MKLTTKFAVASALAFCALGAVQAADIDAISFEDYTAETRTNVVQSGTMDNGTISIGTAATHWYVTNVVQNDSYVTNEATVYSATCGYPDSFKSATHEQFLKVSTTQPLFRTLNAIPDSSAPADNWKTQPIATAGTYIDTLVQFTPSDNAPTPTSADKIIVWMDANTNLQITAGYLNDDMTTVTITNYATKTDLAVPAKWYRLTVKAIPNLITAGFPGFQVYLDGNDALVPANAFHTFSSTAIDSLYQLRGMTDAQKTLIEANKVFMSLQGSGSSVLLTAVGFQGEGAIDDYVVSDETPNFLNTSVLDFTLAWDTSAGVTAVQYVIGDSTTTNTATSGSTFTLGTASTVTVIPTYASWYAAGDWTTTAGATVAAPTFTVSASGATGTVVAAQVTTPGAAGVTNATLVAAGSEVVTWAIKNGISPDALNASGFAAESYLLNQTSLLAAAPVLTITDITQDATTWTITAKATTSDGTAISLNGINGGLTVETKDSLDATDWTTQTYAASNLTYNANGVATIKVAGGKFMKAYIQPTK